MFEQMETLDFTTYTLFLCVNPNGYLKKLQGSAFNNGMSAVRCSAQEWGVPSYFSGFWKSRVSDFIPALDYIIVATLTWPSVGVKPNTWKSWGFGVPWDSWMFRVRQQDPKHLALGVFLVSLERSWSVDIENALALGIWTSVAQVMGKRRAGSQIGSLTPDH